MGNNKQSLYTIITPEQARKQNQREAAGGSNAEYMSFKGDPRYPSEYFSPEELDASVVKAFKSKEEEEAFKRKQLEKQVATMMNAYDWKRPLATRGPNQGDTSLQNIAAASIGAPLLLFNPATSTIATGPIAHAIEVAMNPLAAETMLGAFLGTGAQAAGITAAIYNASNTIDKWRNGNFDLYDIPYFALDAASAVPVINTVTGLADDAVRMVNNAYKTQRAARNATKPMTHGDPGLAQDYINAAGNAEGIHVDNAAIINQQQLGNLKSHHPSKLTDAERLGDPKEIRNNINNIETFKSMFDTSPRTQPSGSHSRLVQNFIDDINNGRLWHEYDLNEGAEWKLFLDDLNSTGTNIWKPTKHIKRYIDGLDDILDSDLLPTLQRTNNGKMPPMVDLYRRYLARLGYNPNDLTVGDISKLLAHYYNTLTNNTSGKVGKQIFWHGVSGSDYTAKGTMYGTSWYRPQTQTHPPIETFDVSKIGLNTGNAGRVGPGMYFSTVPGYSGKYAGYNIQPYIINDIEELVPSNVLGYSGSTGNHIMDYHINISRNTKGVSPREFVHRLIKSLPDESKKLVVDVNESASPYVSGFKEPSVDVRYRGPSQNIKSLFPHPSRYQLQPDGTVTFTPTDWSDVRFNFKQGGKIINPGQ